MKKTSLSVKALKQNRVPLLSTIAPTVRQVVERPEQFVLSRRQVIGLAGLASLGAAPLASAVESALSSTYTLRQGRGRVAFSVAGVERWVIDAKMFDGNAKVDIQKKHDALTVTLSHAFYPGTNVPADLTVVITNGLRATAVFTLDKIGGGFSADFIPWLLQRSTRAATTKQKRYTIGDVALTVGSNTTVRFLPSWTLQFEQDVQVDAGLNSLQCGAVAVGRGWGADRSLLTATASTNYTVLRASRSGFAWNVPISFDELQDWEFASYPDSFNSFTVQATADGRCATLFHDSTDEKVAIKPPTEVPTTLFLRDVRLARVSGDAAHVAMVARFAKNPVWVAAQGASMEVADSDANQPLEIEIIAGNVKRFIVAPTLLRYSINVPGAITHPTPVHAGSALAFLPNNLHASTLPKCNFHLASLQIDFKQGAQLQDTKLLQTDVKKSTVKKSLGRLGKTTFTPAGNPKISVIRPEDLLVLTFEFSGLPINKGAGTFGGGSAGKLIVHFQPQHIAERAFFYVNDPDKPKQEAGATPNSAPKASGSNEPLLDPPIDAIMAHASRLVFDVPAGYTGKYSIEGLLDWSKFKQRVSPSAKPPDVAYTLNVLSSSFLGRYSSDSKSNAKTSRTYLEKKGSYTASKSNTKMNSQLASRLDPNKHAAIISGYESSPDYSSVLTNDLVSSYVALLNAVNPPIREPLADETSIEYPYRLMMSPNAYAGWAHSTKPKINPDNNRAELWHTRLGVKQSDGTVSEQAAYFRTMRAIWSPDVGTDYLMSAKFKERPFRTSINRRDRHEIVQLTSNYGMATNDAPVDVKRFMLTSLGAWADMTGAWDPKAQDSLDVEQWVQRGTQGRDHFVRVCYKGFLFPFGNRATLVKETERKFRRTPRGDMAAYLMQRLYIILRERVREFPANGLKGMKYQGRDFPFRKITINTLVTPNLELPVSLKPGTMSSNSFWPMFNLNGSSDVKWTCVGTDWDGNEAHFSTPLAFIANTDAGTANCQTWITNNYPTETARRSIAMAGQQIAFAPSIKKGDTALPTTTFKLMGYYSDTVPTDTPRFFPSMEKSSVRIEKVSELLGTATNRDVSFYDKYLEHAFEQGAKVAQGVVPNLANVKNPSQLFLKLLNPLNMNFNASSDKSGGLAAPSIDISSLSRLMGPVAGDLSDVTKAAVAIGNFDPMQYFKDILNSKILGDITLQDVLNFVSGIMDNMDKMPGLDKKDDFGVGDDVNAIKSKADEIKAGAQKLVGSIEQEVKDAKDAVEQEVQKVKDEINDYVNNGKKIIQDRINEWKKRIEDKATELKSEVDKAIKPLKDAGNEAYKKYEEAASTLDVLKQGLQLVYEWQTEIKGSPGNLLVPLNPGATDKDKKAILYLKAQLTKKLDAKPPEFYIYGSVSNFIINLIGDGAAQFLIIEFNKISFESKNGAKPDINPDIKAVEFAGPLKFVNKLKDLIPKGGGGGGVGFSFDFSVLPTGVTASLIIGLPNVTVGVFSLQNMSFLMRLSVPFDGRPFSAYFAFCTRENPFRLTIMVFGGGGFFGIEISPKGVLMLEAAFEFGGNFAFDCGVASGGASVMAGIYYKMEMKTIDGKDVQQSELTGYFRLNGNLSILGIIRVSLLFELKLTWQSNGKVFGVATIEVEIEILFISFSVGVTVERQLKGSDGDPTFTDMLPQPSLWEEYCNAYA